MRRLSITATCVFAILVAPIVGAFAESGIQMLPPQDFSGVSCDKSAISGGGLLYWDGIHAIQCVPYTQGYSSGELYTKNSIQADKNMSVGGNIGIGTNSPGQALEIMPDASSYFTGAWIHGTVSSVPGKSLAPGVSFPIDATAQSDGYHMAGALGVATWAGAFTDQSQVGDFVVRSGSGGDVHIGNVVGTFPENITPTHMIIKNNGDVGIGSTAPMGNLDVENSSGTARFCLNSICVSSMTQLDGTNGSNGSTGATGPIGPQGPAGPQGQQGPSGSADSGGLCGLGALSTASGAMSLSIPCVGKNPLVGCPSGYSQQSLSFSTQCGLPPHGTCDNVTVYTCAHN